MITPLLGRNEVARLLNVSPFTVDDLRRRGILPSVSFGPRCHRYQIADIEAVIEQRRKVA